MNNLIDTLLNVGIFVFIGLMLWLYFKDVPEQDGPADNQDPSGIEYPLGTRWVYGLFAVNCVVTRTTSDTIQGLPQFLDGTTNGK